MISELEKTAGYLNQVYYRLELKRAELTHALFHRIFELESGFYNGHYSKREDGSFYMDYYPIHVISVKLVAVAPLPLQGHLRSCHHFHSN